MLEMFQGACESFMADRKYLLFWILREIAESSSEVGNHARFQETLKTFESASFAQKTVEQLNSGINGNFGFIIQSMYPESAPFRSNERRYSILPTGHNKILPRIYKADRNKVWMYPDIWFGETGDRGETIAEVKALHDWTTPTHYGRKKDKHGVADDADKLRRIRLEPFAGNLLQVVFFLCLPNYSYCSGKSYGQAEPHKCRDYYLFTRGIQEQFGRLREHLTEKPAWLKNDAPSIVSLDLPDKSTCQRLECWISRVFEPDDPVWKFVAKEQLAGASVGCAIWQH